MVWWEGRGRFKISMPANSDVRLQVKEKSWHLIIGKCRWSFRLLKSHGINAGNSQLSNKIRTSIEVLLTDIIFWELKHRGHVKCNNDSESAVMKGVVHGR